MRVPVCESGLRTTTFTAPAACAGVVAVIDVLLTKLTPVAAVPPRVTVAPLTKFVPVIVTDVAPFVLPELGEMAVTVGAGAGPPLFDRIVVSLRSAPGEELRYVDGESTIWSRERPSSRTCTRSVWLPLPAK